MSRQEQARLAVHPILHPSWPRGQSKGKGCSRGSQMAQLHLPVAPWLMQLIILESPRSCRVFNLLWSQDNWCAPVQNSLRQLHPVHLKVTPQVLADGPGSWLVLVFMCSV